MLDVNHRQRSCVRTLKDRNVRTEKSSGDTLKMRKLRERVARDYIRGRIRVDATSRIPVMLKGYRATMPVKPLTVILLMAAAAVLLSCQIGGDNAEAAATPSGTAAPPPATHPPASTPVSTATATVPPTSTLASPTPTPAPPQTPPTETPAATPAATATSTPTITNTRERGSVGRIATAHGIDTLQRPVDPRRTFRD